MPASNFVLFSISLSHSSLIIILIENHAGNIDHNNIMKWLNQFVAQGSVNNESNWQTEYINLTSSYYKNTSNKISKTKLIPSQLVLAEMFLKKFQVNKKNQG